MQVSIKTLKLNKALFDQVQFLDKKDILDDRFMVLGWCVVKSKTNLNLKYIVLSDGISGELRKMLFFSFITEADGYLELSNSWSTISNQKIKIEDSDRSWRDGDTSNLRNLLEKIKRVATEKGQFYL